MIHLICAIVSSTLITFFMRLSAGKSKNELSLLSMNYLACACLSYLFMDAKTLFPNVQGVHVTYLLGVIGGFLYLGSFLLLKWNVRKNGVTLPATFMKLGVLVPTVLSALIFKEKMAYTTVVGIALALFSIFLLKEKSDEKAKNTAGLVILLAAGGLADAMSKIFEETAPGETGDHFLFYVFSVALILCLILVFVRKQKYSLWDVGFGLLIGIPNYFSSRFLLLSLSSVPAVVAYPTFSAGTIVLTALLGAVIFREKFPPRKLAALFIILVALALLNLPS